jgi:hypothetical protein
MSAVERNILSILEPKIVLDELKIPDVESGTANSGGDAVKEPPSKFLNIIPQIRINQYDIGDSRLESFTLNCTGFYPTCRFTFYDEDGLFTARHYPTDGDIIQLYIRSAGEETTFKPIRIDFTIEDIKPIGGGGSTNESPQLMVDGRMNIPNLFTENVEYYNSTSWNALLKIAEKLKLGFASNVEDTADEQVWTNPYDTAEKFIRDITANSYLDENSFFNSYIDPYYNLTLVEANRLFDVTDQDLEASLTYSQNSGDTFGGGSPEAAEYDSPNVLTNIIQASGTSRYISTYQQINKSGQISKDNGYKRYTQYWDLTEKKFISEFVDPIVSEVPGMIPATKGRLVPDENGNLVPEGPRTEQVKYKYLGTQGDNVHPNFYYSAILNFQNNAEIEKFGMVLELDMVNPALTRYSRIYCQIWEFAQPVKDVLLAPSNDENVPSGTQRRAETPENAGNDASSQAGVINEFLSGFYVITGIDYFLTEPGPIRQRVHLRRREVVPST